MKKKVIFFITLLVVSILFTPKVLAAETEPTVLVVGEETVVIGNGIELTIVEPSEEEKSTYGAVIKYGDNKEIKVPADAWVFGGTHNDNSTTVNSKITMEGGQLYAIVGGGLHKSTVDVSTITINGGTLKSVYGGGVASTFFDSPTVEESAHNYTGTAEESTTRVGTAHITINGGTLTKYIYGGGMGYNYIENAFITVNGGNQTTAILTAGGANGYTGESTVTINDGNIGTIQSVNRGSIDTTTLTVEGGTIGTIYAGGADNDNTVNGTVNSSAIIVKEGSVDELKVGTNGGSNTSAIDAVTVTYNKNAVNKIDQTTFSEESIVEMIKLTFVAEGETDSLEIPVGFAFNESEIEYLKKELTETLGNTGYKFDNFYADEDYTTIYDMTSEFTTDTTIYIKLVQLRQEENQKEVTNPNTSDISLYATIATIILASVGLGYAIKKRKFN